jgi:hypothetical protein
VSRILASQEFEEIPGFWGLQFRASPTPAQTVFDVVFGILMPLGCFYLDPGIVAGDSSTPLGRLSIFIYSLSALAIFMLALWFLFEHRMGSGAAVFSGVFLAGAICSFSIGVLILPLTLIGILFVVGLLGLVPFLTGFVYLRNAVRAINACKPAAGGPIRIRAGVIVLSAVAALGLPALGQWKINDIVRQSMAEIISQDSGSPDAAIGRIKRLRWLVDADEIVRAYEMETNAERKERLGRAYKGITGEDIETRLRILRD